MPKKILYRDEKRQIEFDRYVALPVMNLRAAQEDDKRTLKGLASPFDQETVIGGWFREVIRAGAFAKTIQEMDQVGLWNHDSGKPMARRTKGTLRLFETKRGLEFECDLGEQTWANDAWISVERGDVQGCSIGFQVIKQTWTTVEDGSELDLRDIIEVKLYEISLVTFPAYESTVVETARSIVEAAIEQGDLKRKFSFTETTEKTDRPAAGAERATDEGGRLPAGPGNSSSVDTTCEPGHTAAVNAERTAANGDHSKAGTLQMLHRIQQQAEAEILTF